MEYLLMGTVNALRHAVAASFAFAKRVSVTDGRPLSTGPNEPCLFRSLGRPHRLPPSPFGRIQIREQELQQPHTRFARPISLSWLTRPKNFSRSMSTIQRLPSAMSF